MHAELNKEEWVRYCDAQMRELAPQLEKLGYTLDTEQPQIIGERFLTRPITGGRKLVLFGHRLPDGLRVVIKTSDEDRGIEELKKEHASRNYLERIRFAYKVFTYPNELYSGMVGNHQILITEFIEQEKPFLERTLKEQFAIALSAFKTQEAAHATTDSHEKLIRECFEVMTGDLYFDKTQRYAQDLVGLVDRENPVWMQLTRATDDSIRAIGDSRGVLDQYGGFLTHWDFTPQNFRVRNGELYILDHTSIRFGNKYESWARFINFMELYNPALASALIEYVHLNRTNEESESLRLMRIFRCLELIRYYASWLHRTDGDLRALTEARIAFWTEVLRAILDKKDVPSELVETYKKTRDRLRTEDEKKRQVGLH